MTGLYNRRGLFELGVYEIKRCARLKRPISCLFTDIDYFKQFNDKFSYEVGDLVIRTVAECMQGSLRSMDLVGRYGGEELVALLPELNLPRAAQVAERVRKNIERKQLHSNHGILSVTVSIGVASLHIDSLTSKTTDDDEEALHNLLEKAGQMLHVAKANGRNRVESEVLT